MPTPEQTDTSRPVVIAMLLRDRGTTGVQTHVRMLRQWLALQGRPAALVTPFDALGWSRLVLLVLVALRRLLETLAPPLAVTLYRRGHGWCLRQALRRHLRHAPGALIYAQCPVSAAVALELPSDCHAAVAMAVHFNESQADEWADKGAFARGSPHHGRIRDFEAKWLPAVDALVFVSRYMQQRVCMQHPACVGVEQAVIPNFVSTPAPAPAGSPAADLVCIGTLEPRKNQHYLLDIIAAARDQGQPLSVTIVGDGPDSQALAARARELGIGEWVRFTGFSRHAASLIHVHRALVHVARIENLPLVVLEAFACGKPVFAVPAGGIPEILSDGVEGRHLPQADPAGAARIIRQSLDDPTSLAAFSRAAFERHQAALRTEIVAARLENFLRHVPRRRDAAPSRQLTSPG
jgi:glycosyltransferase involved in cell wall biosynthesis